MKILDNRYVYDESEVAREGGMGSVVRATDHKTSGPVALKFVPTSGNPTLSLVFERECKALQALSHENIVKLLDGGRDPESGRSYLVLEWIDRNLEDYLAEFPLEGWDDFFEKIGRPILKALGYALEHDWLHRDLKPTNVLVTNEGVAKLADFGIAKWRGAAQFGQTLRDYKSRPFAPPETDSGELETTRDVYSFGVLALQSLLEERITDDAGVREAIDSNEPDLPDEILAILTRCVSERPEDRPVNVQVLLTDLEQTYRSRSKAWDRRQFNVALNPTVLRDFRLLMPKLKSVEAKARIFEELNAAQGLRLKPLAQQAQGNPRIQIFGSLFRIVLAQDPSMPGRLLVSDIRRQSPTELDRDAERAWAHPSLRFADGVPADRFEAQKAIERLYQDLREHEDLMEARLLREQHEYRFREWRNLLSALEEIATGGVRPVRFRGAESHGHRLVLKVREAPPAEVLGREMMITLEDRSTITGQVEGVTADEVVLYVEADLPPQPPRIGDLRIDDRASRAAVRRQLDALDAVRSNRSAKPNLRELLTFPEQCRVPEPSPIDSTKQALDDSQRDGLKSALGSPDIFTIEGPPGTGKTRLIAEMIHQICKRSPQTHVLLCSQTHIALDNALDRLQAIDPGLSLVRVGRRGDERIAPGSHRLLLENKAREWAERVRKRSEVFLRKWAKESGIDEEQLLLASTVARLRGCRKSFNELDERLERLGSELELAERRHQDTKETGVGDDLPELEDTITTVREQFSELEIRRKAAERELRQALQAVADTKHPDAEELVDSTVEDLEIWEEMLTSSQPAGNRYRALRDLVDEWQLRLTRAEDFQAALLREANVVAGTCIGFASLPSWEEMSFDVCIIDEASKASPTELLVPMSRAKSIIVVGDPRQLPPYLDENLRDPEWLQRFGLRRESFERTLLDMLLDELPQPCRTQLRFQHRMVPPIGNLISECFYEGELVSLTKDERRFYPAIKRPVLWLSTSSEPSRRELADGSSFKNQLEARVIAGLLKRLDKFLGSSLVGRSESKVEVICLAGYVSQVKEIEQACKAGPAFRYLQVEYSSVDAFQGREAGVCIYSVTRSNESRRIGFLAEQRRLNVALSRARDQLVMVGDEEFLDGIEGQNPFSEVLAHVRRSAESCLIEPAGSVLR